MVITPPSHPVDTLFQPNDEQIKLFNGFLQGTLTDSLYRTLSADLQKDYKRVHGGRPVQPQDVRAEQKRATKRLKAKKAEKQARKQSRGR
jgi:hypothetical protein